LERDSNNYYFIIRGGKDRLVPVHNSVIEYLRSYSAQLPDEREWFFPSACGHYSIIETKNPVFSMAE
jgi:integrase